MEKEPFHILIAEDDEADRLLFKEALSEIEIKTTVHIVKDGIHLLERLNSSNIPLPDLLFLDLNMPRKNGFECLKEIRSIERLKDISIAIYSTSDNKKDIDETFRSGANIYVTKPSDFKLLKQVLEKAVKTASQYQNQTMNRDNFLLLL